MEDLIRRTGWDVSQRERNEGGCGGTYLDFADAAGIACFPQAVRLGACAVLAVVQDSGILDALRAHACGRPLGGWRTQRPLVGAQGVVGLLLQHIAQALDLGEGILLRIGLQRPLLLLLLGVRWLEWRRVDRCVMRVLRPRWKRILRR